MHKIINLGILAHVDAGKTTVTEGFLVASGVKARMGRVDHGDTTTDSLLIERQRGVTVRASTVSFSYQGVKINLVDTPGHMDFIAEVERSLSVLDGAILVISAREGVQPQTRVIFSHLRAMGIPTMLFINKIDRAGVQVVQCVREIRESLAGDLAVMQELLSEGTREARAVSLPLSEGALSEALIERDEALLGAYLRDAPIAEPMLHGALIRQTRAGRLFPVYMGAALHGVGVAPLLEAVCKLFGVAAPVPGPLSALVYKAEWDDAGRKRLYFRVFQGALTLRETICAASGTPFRVRGLLALDAGRTAPAQRIEAGDIGVLLDAEDVKCGDWLGERLTRPTLQKPARPLLTVAIAPQQPGERDRLLSALTRLTEEDPLLRLSLKPETGEITVHLYGALQREVIEAWLLERYGLQTVVSALMTRFAKKPKGPGFAEIRIGSAGNLHSAGIALEVYPLPPGTGNQYETNVSYGELTKSFQNAVQEGVLAGLSGALDTEIADTRVVFVDMDFSSVTSTPADFRRLAPLVLQKALLAAGTVLLEPWLSYSLSVPIEQQKHAISALLAIRATLETVAHGECEMTVHGEVPLHTSKGFAAELASLTQGKGVFETTFLAYREAAQQD